MTNDALAEAGREGLMAINVDEVVTFGGDQHYAALARAVLESLGIEWTGEHEWRVLYGRHREFLDAPGGVSIEATKEQAREWRDKADMQDREPSSLQRRPNLTVRWQDVTE